MSWSMPKFIEMEDGKNPVHEAFAIECTLFSCHDKHEKLFEF